MSFIASSSRSHLGIPSPSQIPALFVRHKSGAHRYVKGPPPRPRMPKTQSPYLAHPRSFDPSTSASGSSSSSNSSTPLEESMEDRSQAASSPFPPSATFTRLQNSSLSLHHSAPDSAPSYTVGNVPDLLSWLGGTSVRLSGEERAPMLREMKPPVGNVAALWTSEIKDEIKRLRDIGLTRTAIMKRLNLPVEQAAFVPRIAEEAPRRTEAREAKLEDQKLRWSYKKRLFREIRQRRKDFW